MLFFILSVIVSYIILDYINIKFKINTLNKELKDIEKYLASEGNPRLLEERYEILNRTIKFLKG